jgi:hypothetical protein
LEQTTMTKTPRSRERLLAEAVALRLRKFRGTQRWASRKMWYELGFRDGWKAALTGTIHKEERKPGGQE